MNKFVPTVAMPSDPLPKHLWMRRIAKKEFNPAQVNEHTILGAVIVDAYKINPEGTLEMIADLAQDNPVLMMKVIGKDNFKKIV